MKKISITNSVKYRYSIIIFVFLVISQSYASVRINFEEDPKKYFVAGKNYYEEGMFENAVTNFEKCYELFHHTSISYMISWSYAHLNNRAKAKEFANLSLNGFPKLGDEQISSIKTVLEWANTNPSEGSIGIRAKFDNMGSYYTPPPAFNFPESQESLSKETIKMGQIVTNLNYTGKWKCNDGGIYYIRQVGNTIWWLGQSSNDGKSWSNVFHGKIEGSIIKGTWADLPIGASQNSGKLSLKIIDFSTIQRLEFTGGFGGSQWSR